MRKLAVENGASKAQMVQQLPTAPIQSKAYGRMFLTCGQKPPKAYCQYQEGSGKAHIFLFQYSGPESKARAIKARAICAKASTKLSKEELAKIISDVRSQVTSSSGPELVTGEVGGKA